MSLNESIVQMNLDMTDSMGPGKLVRHMQNSSYTYDEYLLCIGLGPSIQSVISKFTCIVFVCFGQVISQN